MANKVVLQAHITKRQRRELRIQAAEQQISVALRLRQILEAALPDAHKSKRKE
jgi:hypothetical protein